MKTVLVIIIIALIAYIIKALIDLNALVLQVIKAKELNKVSNNLEKKYQFIKGLY